jgi:hypothetical protein
MGSQTTASGESSVAMGMLTTASGGSSTALGWKTIASGYSSTAMGLGIEASGYNSFAIALNNQTNTVVSQDNTMSIMGGKVGIGTVAPSEHLEVYNGTSTGTYTTTGWMHSSDSRLKTNVIPIKNALDLVLNMEGIYFNWINDTDKGKRQIGLIAQDVEKIIPEVVSIDQNGYFSLSYGNITPVLIEAFKEQSTKIDNQQTEIEELKLQNRLLRELIVDINKRIENLEK